MFLGLLAKTEALCLFTQPKKEQQQIQKQKATRNARKSVWKSNNQGVNEETFIQTGRRGRDGQPVQRGHMARWQLEDWVGKMVTGRLGEAAGGGPGGPTFACG